MTSTLKKFGYPGSLVKEYTHWMVLLRPAQVTLGSLILIEKSGAERFSDLSPEAFAEYAQAVKEVEWVLFALFKYDRINYLMLMMVDLEVHFHVIPRYETIREFNGITFCDSGWPGLPDLSCVAELPPDVFLGLVAKVRQEFNQTV
jgi:diadenosine tetraphosphate (Ap4A) HIT family hydrolase